MFDSADSDDRVDPLHARKMAALLQADSTGGPVLLRIERNSSRRRRPRVRACRSDGDRRRLPPRGDQEAGELRWAPERQAQGGVRNETKGRSSRGGRAFVSGREIVSNPGLGAMTTTLSAPSRPLEALRLRARSHRARHRVSRGRRSNAAPLLVSWLLRTRLGLDAADYAVGFTFYGAFLINDPHFTVTYILFYRDFRRRAFRDAFEGRQRVRYVIAGLVVPAVLAASAIASPAPPLRARARVPYPDDVRLLVGWHYVKQGFGVASVLAARRGVRFEGRERLALPRSRSARRLGVCLERALRTPERSPRRRGSST